MTARHARLDRAAPKGVRRVERWLIGLVMGVLAYVIEKAVLRSIKGGRTRPKPQPTTAIGGAGAEITAE